MPQFNLRFDRKSMQSKHPSTHTKATEMNRRFNGIAFFSFSFYFALWKTITLMYKTTRQAIVLLVSNKLKLSFLSKCDSGVRNRNAKTTKIPKPQHEKQGGQKSHYQLQIGITLVKWRKLHIHVVCRYIACWLLVCIAHNN